MKYIYILTWCIIFNTEVQKKDCSNIEVYLLKEKAAERIEDLKEQKRSFNGFIEYRNIKLDSITIDSLYNNKELISLIKNE